MKKELLAKMLLVLLAVVAGLSMTSCGDDDDEPQTQIYSYGFESISGSGLSDMFVIEKAFKDALGVTNTPFTMTGSANECDAKVKAACERAAKSLESVTLSSKGSFTVTNNTEGKVIYTYNFVPSDK